MTAREEDDALIDAFVVPARRERMRLLLGKPKRRRDATRALAHFGDLDPRWVVPIASSAQTPIAMERELRRCGAGDTCHVVSEDPDIDGKRMALREALEFIVGRGMGTLLSCVPGSLAFFEGEGPSDRFILAREPRAGR